MVSVSISTFYISTVPGFIHREPEEPDRTSAGLWHPLGTQFVSEDICSFVNFIAFWWNLRMQDLSNMFEIILDMSLIKLIMALVDLNNAQFQYFH